MHFFIILLGLLLYGASVNAQVSKLKDIVGEGINGRVEGDLLGRAVANYGDFIVVGAPGQDYNSDGSDSVAAAGAVYIFSKNKGGANNWGLIKKIVSAGNNGRRFFDQFGTSVAIHEDVIVVGVPAQDFNSDGLDSVKDAGAAYIYYKDAGGVNNWGLVKKIVGVGTNGRMKNDGFGYSVAVSQDIVVVGASGQDYDTDGTDFEENAGAAYVFSKNEGGLDNWGLVKKISASVAKGRDSYDGFGTSVAVSGNTIVVGAYRHGYDADGSDHKISAGAAYIFYKDRGGINNWGFVKKLLNSYDRGNNDHFGISVDVFEDKIIVGAPDYYRIGTDSDEWVGAAFIFNKDNGGIDNWGAEKKLINKATNGGAGPDRFGWAVSITNHLAVVSDYFHDFNASGFNFVREAGAAYIYSQDKGGSNNWGLEAKVSGVGINGRVAQDNFGFSASVSNNIIVIGTWNQSFDPTGQNPVQYAGKISVYQADPSITSITEVTSSESLKISCFEDKVIVSFIQEGDYDLELFDITGKCLRTSKITAQSNSIEEIDVQGVATGYYIFRLKGQSTYKTAKVFLYCDEVIIFPRYLIS